MLCVQSSLLTCVLTHRLQKAAATLSTADQRAVRRCVAPDAQHARGVPGYKYSQYHPLRKSGIKKTRHGFLREKLRNHEIPQDLDDFELRNPVNPLFWAILS